MPDVLVLPDSIARPADVLPPMFGCSWRDGGLDAGWVHLAGEVDIATTPQLQSTLRQSQLHARLVVLTGTVDDVEIHGLDPGEPPVEVLLRLSDEGPAS
jgi:hypothetical protein